MKLKTDTKEKFHAITLLEPSLSADMTAEMADSLLSYLQNDVCNVVLNCKELKNIDRPAAEMLVKIQQKFYENDSSFVICEIGKTVEDFLDSNDLLEIMNLAPTQSEAFDIVQMEEIEREMLDGGE